MKILMAVDAFIAFIFINFHILYKMFIEKMAFQSLYR